MAFATGIQFYGLSTDIKPVSPTNGWSFFESDTGYTYVATGGVWVISFGINKNQSVTSQAGFAADTYLIGSNISLGSVSTLRIGSRYHCVFDVTKTAAGIAAPIITLRFGTLGTVSDVARCTFTFNAQTAVIDNGEIELDATFRVIGASAIIQSQCTLGHNLAVTGLGSVNPTGWQQIIITSAGFSSVVASSIIGVSVNGGALASWTITKVQSELTL